jgi:hypothetical protein
MKYQALITKIVSDNHAELKGKSYLQIAQFIEKAGQSPSSVVIRKALKDANVDYIRQPRIADIIDAKNRLEQR